MVHFAGLVLSRLVRATEHQWATGEAMGNRLTISNRQSNGSHGIYQALLTLEGDPNNYRLILAPANAPITINGRPIGEHFAKPLGDR